MPSRYNWISIVNLRGGRNAADDPFSLGENQVVEARNGDWHRVGFFRKRPGSTAPAIGSAFTGVLSSLIAHYPSNDMAAAELWGVDNAATPVVARMAAATTFASVTLTDNVATGTGHTVRGASYNGKLFLAYDSAVDRTHVWDPNLATPRVRRLGLGTPAAPTAANTGSGSYAAVIRYYRVRYRIKNGSVIDAQSEPGASVSFTPSGSGTHTRVTKPASISEQETHWVIEGSNDNITFYELSEVAVGTTTYDDNATYTAAGTFDDGDISAVLGTYTVPKSCKYVIAAFNRILLAGNYESGPQSRVYYTPPKGTSDRGDDEKIPDTLGVKNRVDLDEGVGGDITGFAGPIYESVYVFKYQQIRKLVSTGFPSPPLAQATISSKHGAIEQECITVGKDRLGRDAVYFLDAQVGPMIVGPTPPVPIGDGVRDLWDNANLAATTRVGGVLYVPSRGTRGQVWFWWATGSSNTPDTLCIYDIDTGGWSVADTGGSIRTALCFATFARTPGASMSRDVVPYVSPSGSNNTLLRCLTTDTSDNSTTFQALIKTRPLDLNGGKEFRTSEPVLVTRAAAGVTLTVTLDIDFGLETRSTTVALDAAASETRVIKRLDGMDVAAAHVVQFQIGDAAAIANAWVLEKLYIPVAVEDTGP